MTSDAKSAEHDAMVEEVWRNYLTTGGFDKDRRQRHLFRVLPTREGRRCKNCYAPFAGVGGTLVRLVYGKRPSNMNPRLCNICEQFALKYHGGAEIDLSLLFADIRGSTALAEGVSPSEFSQLINRFYTASTNVLIQTDAFIDKLSGDEVAAIYVPGLAGPEYARRAVEAAQDLLRATGHSDPGGPWVPVGAGVHSGVAFVGAVGSKDGLTDITVLGDVANTTARLASQAGAGEVIVSEAAVAAAGLDTEGLEQRQLELKGRSEPVKVWVIHVAPG